MKERIVLIKSWWLKSATTESFSASQIHSRIMTEELHIILKEPQLTSSSQGAVGAQWLHAEKHVADAHEVLVGQAVEVGQHALVVDLAAARQSAVLLLPFLPLLFLAIIITSIIIVVVTVAV
eukprot:m.48812 g.48812  ORF g.48812 m.48812 type:complete len:122 (+) comp12759_c0_seq1:858-1223(+)